RKQVNESNATGHRLLAAAFFTCLAESIYALYTFYNAFINTTFARNDLEAHWVFILLSWTASIVCNPYILLITSPKVRGMFRNDWFCGTNVVPVPQTNH